MDWLTATRWSPYAVGIAIGVLSWATLLISQKPLGCSTTFARTAGMIEKALRGQKALQRPYYLKTKPTIDWQWMLVLGVVIGSFISSVLSGSFSLRWVPSRWALTFGDAAVPRQVAALVGGILLGFGARWADGCTSGHGISGTMQLAVSGWISAICFFIGGIAMAFLLYGLPG